MSDTQQPQPSSYLPISEQEWELAQQYVEAIRAEGGTLPCKVSRKTHEGLNHSFLAYEEGGAVKIVAMAKAKLYSSNNNEIDEHGQLGKGVFGRVKLVQTRDNQLYVVKIEQLDKTAQAASVEQATLKEFGELQASFTRDTADKGNYIQCKQNMIWLYQNIWFYHVKSHDVKRKYCLKRKCHRSRLSKNVDWRMK